MSRYAIGVDFGTESGRAVLVDVASGVTLASAVSLYSNGVIDAALPADAGATALASDWALQDPADYLRVFREAIPAVLDTAGVDPADVIGVGVDFTACTMLPTQADGTPLCDLAEFRQNPHAWVKLWKHHAAQPEADRINAVARESGQAWLARYGGKISSEWFFSKALQILDEAPEVYAAADRLIEAADWVDLATHRRRDPQRVHGRLQGHVVEGEGFPPRVVLRGPPPRLRGRRRRARCRRDILAAGRAGRRPVRRGGGLDGPAAGDGRRGRQRRCPRGRARRDGHRGRAGWS